MVDSLLYQMESRLKKQIQKQISEWKRIPMKGIGDNNGYWEMTLPPNTSKEE